MLQSSDSRKRSLMRGVILEHESKRGLIDDEFNSVASGKQRDDKSAQIYHCLRNVDDRLAGRVFR